MLTNHGSFATIRWFGFLVATGPGTIHALRNWKIMFNACLPANTIPKATILRTPVRLIGNRRCSAETLLGGSK